MVPGLPPVVLGRVTTGLGGVKLRFKGAQQSSSHIWMLAVKYQNFKGLLSKTSILLKVVRYLIIYNDNDKFYNYSTNAYSSNVYKSLWTLSYIS